MLIDLLTYILHYLPEILLALPCLYWAMCEIRTDRGWNRVFVVAGTAGVILAGVNLFSSIPHATGHAWSAARLAPAAGWVRGYRLFYPSGEGPLMVQMYGPVSAMVYLPAVWIASSPTVAVLLAALTNTLLFISPAVWFIRRSIRGAPASLVLVSIAIFFLLAFRQFVLLEAATRVTIDSPAIALAVFAMGAAIRGSARPLVNGLLCGTLAALSIWTKLTLIPIPFAILLSIAMTHQFRETLRFLLGLVIAAVSITGVLVLCLGTEMILQNVIIPMRQPWQWPTLRGIDAYLRALRWIWRYSAPAYWALLLAIVIAMLQPKLRPSAGLWSRWPRWPREQNWLLICLAAIFVIPTATLAYVKVGGAWNNAVAGSYFALLASATALAAACAAPTGAASDSVVVRLPLSVRMARTCVLSLLVYGIWAGGNPLKLFGDGIDAWRSAGINEHEQAFQYARQHPGEVYFPSYPLSTLLAEGKLYHFAAGIDSAEWGGETVDAKWLGKWMPVHHRLILYPKGSRPPAMLDRFVDFKIGEDDSSMPGWVILKREPALP